jgi:ArsR family transcriptional regulator
MGAIGSGVDIRVYLADNDATREQVLSGKQRTKYEARATIVKALGNPARLMIVDELTEHGQRCVHELTELVGIDSSTVSRHLAVLRNAGIVESEKRGTTVYYRLRVKCIRRFFECVESVLRASARDRHDALV